MVLCSDSICFSKLPVLKFKIVEQVEPLRKLLDTRNRLRELMSAVDRADGLEDEPW